MRLESQKEENKLASKRTYEVMYIAQAETADDDITKINEGIQKLVETEGGTIVRIDNIGRKKMAYEIKRKKEGYYVLLEIEGSGKEIAEIERRFRVNDVIVRYITVRVDEDRKAAEKIRAKREDRLTKRNTNFKPTNEVEEEFSTVAAQESE
jgi:small subunit ribosomal protein S6